MGSKTTTRGPKAAKQGDARPPDAGDEDGLESRSVDQIFDDLEAIVGELEAGELSLERAIERFEEGVKLARRGEQVLAAVEERVEMLLADRDELVPFRPEEPGEDDDDEL
jgi:exodeoxyribonuclease VII small subunit